MVVCMWFRQAASDSVTFDGHVAEKTVGTRIGVCAFDNEHLIS